MKLSKPELKCVLLACWLSLAGCPATEIKPVEIVLNEDACWVCLMAVTSRSFAAETVSSNGTVEYYDDIGCLVVRAREPGLPQNSGSFVIDLDEGAWIRHDLAWYLWSESLPTPMSYGLAAFANKPAAEAKLEQYPGRVVDWPVLLEEFEPGN